MADIAKEATAPIVMEAITLVVTIEREVIIVKVVTTMAMVVAIAA